MVRGSTGRLSLAFILLISLFVFYSRYSQNWLDQRICETIMGGNLSISRPNEVPKPKDLPPERLKFDEKAYLCEYVINKNTEESLKECELYQWTFNQRIAIKWLKFNDTEQRRFKEYRAKYPVYPAFIKREPLYVKPVGTDLQVCLIAKSMSTMGKMIMCNLERSIKHQEPVMNEKQLMANCRQMHRHIWTQQPELISFVVIRDPLKRFISVYNYVAVCGKHGADFPKMVDQFDLLWRKGKSFEGWTRKPASYSRHHLKPQSWDCDFYKRLEKYRVIDYEENLRDQWVEVFLDSGLGIDLTEKALDTMNYTTANHGKDDGIDYMKILLNSPDLLRKVVNMYFYDFLLFGYPLPAGI